MKREIKTGLIERAISVKRYDKKTRTVEVEFSSETPVQTFIPEIGLVDEILDHSRGAVDLGRLNAGAPVLLEHDKFEQLGVVETAEISPDRVGVAVIRFGRSKKAREIFRDVVDGIRRGVSVGYRVKKYIQEIADAGAENILVRAVEWLPYEITITALPADYSLNGRGANLNFKTEIDTMKDDDESKRAAEVTAAVEKATKTEIDRLDNIRAIGEKYDCGELAGRAMTEKWTVAQMNQEVLEILEKKVNTAKPVTRLDLSGRDLSKFSLMRAINAAFSNDWSKAGFERECSQAIEDELSRPPQGFYIPFDIQERTFDQKRVMTVGTDTAGGFLKATDHLAASFVDLLRANALMGTLNARFLTGLVGDVDIPRLDGGVAFNWVAEDGDATPDDAVLGTIALSPKTIVGEVPISRRLLKQATPSVEQMLMDDMAKGAALAIDLAAFSGTGANNQPTGITVTSGIGTSTITSAGDPDRDEMIDFETDVLTANALGGTLAYCTTAPVQGNMKNKNIDTGSGKFLMEGGEVNGYPVRISTQLAANTIIFGNYEDVIIGLWGVLDVEPDRAEKAAAGGLVLRVFQDCDIGIRHAGSFSKNA
jgi:HK97 family phage major capsid protein